MATPSTRPRVSGADLPHHVGQTVSVVGRITNRTPQSVTLETSDGNSVNIATTQGNNYEQIVEIVGIVAPDLSIRESLFVNLGPDFDLINYEELMKLQHHPQVRELFA